MFCIHNLHNSTDFWQFLLLTIKHNARLHLLIQGLADWWTSPPHHTSSSSSYVYARDGPNGLMHCSLNYIVLKKFTVWAGNPFSGGSKFFVTVLPNRPQNYSIYVESSMISICNFVPCSGNEAIRRNLVPRILIARVPLQKWVHSERLMSRYTTNSGLIHVS